MSTASEDEELIRLNPDLADLARHLPEVARNVLLRMVFLAVRSSMDITRLHMQADLNPHLPILECVDRVIVEASQRGLKVTREEVLTLWVVEMYIDEESP